MLICTGVLSPENNIFFYFQPGPVPRPQTQRTFLISQYGGCSKKCRCLQSSDPTWNSNFLLARVASINFCFVSEQNKTEEWDFGFGRMRIRTRTKKMKEGGGEGRKPYLTFLPQPLPALLLMPFFSFLLLRSETTRKHLLCRLISFK